MWAKDSSTKSAQALSIVFATLASLSLVCCSFDRFESSNVYQEGNEASERHASEKPPWNQEQKVSNLLGDNHQWTNIGAEIGKNHLITEPDSQPSSIFERIVQTGVRVRLVCPHLAAVDPQSNSDAVAIDSQITAPSVENWANQQNPVSPESEYVGKTARAAQDFSSDEQLTDGWLLVPVGVSYNADFRNAVNARKYHVKWFKNHVPLLNKDENHSRVYQENEHHYHQQYLQAERSQRGRDLDGVLSDLSLETSLPPFSPPLEGSLSQIGSLSELDGEHEVEATEQQQDQPESTLTRQLATSSSSGSSPIQAASGQSGWSPLAKKDENVNERRDDEKRKLLFSTPKTSKATRTRFHSNTAARHPQLSQQTIYGPSETPRDAATSSISPTFEEGKPFYINKFGELVINKVSQYFAGKYTCSYAGKQSDLILHVQTRVGGTSSSQNNMSLAEGEASLDREGDNGNDSKQKVSNKQVSGSLSSGREVEISGLGDVQRLRHDVTMRFTDVSNTNSRFANHDNGLENDKNREQSSQDVVAPNVETIHGSWDQIGRFDGEIQSQKRGDDHYHQLAIQRLPTKLMRSISRHQHHRQPAHLVESEIITPEDLGTIPGLLYTRQRFICPAIRQLELQKHLDLQIDSMMKKLCQSIELAKSQTGENNTTNNLECYTFGKRVVSGIIKNIHCAATSTTTTYSSATTFSMEQQQHYDKSGSTRSGVSCTETGSSLLDVKWFKDGKLLQFDPDGRSADPKLNAKVIDIFDQFQRTSGEISDDNLNSSFESIESETLVPIVSLLADGNSLIHQNVDSSSVRTSIQTEANLSSRLANQANEPRQLESLAIQQEATSQKRNELPACPLKGLTIEIDGIRKDTAGRYTCALKLSIQRLEKLFKSLRQQHRQNLDNCAHDNDKLCCDCLQEDRNELGRPRIKKGVRFTSNNNEANLEKLPVSMAQNLVSETNQNPHRIGLQPLYEVRTGSNVANTEVPAVTAAIETETLGQAITMNSDDDQNWPGQVQIAQIEPINGREVGRSKEGESPMLFGNKELSTPSGSLNQRQDRPNQANNNRQAANEQEAFVLASGNLELAPSAQRIATSRSILNASSASSDRLLDFLTEMEARFNMSAMMPFKALQTFVLAISENPANSSSVWSTIIEADNAYSRRKLADFKRLKRSLARPAVELAGHNNSSSSSSSNNNNNDNNSNNNYQPLAGKLVEFESQAGLARQSTDSNEPTLGVTVEAEPSLNNLPTLVGDIPSLALHDESLVRPWPYDDPTELAQSLSKVAASKLTDHKHDISELVVDINPIGGHPSQEHRFSTAPMSAKTLLLGSNNEIELAQINGPIDHHRHHARKLEFNDFGGQLMRNGRLQPAASKGRRSIGHNMLLNNAEATSGGQLGGSRSPEESNSIGQHQTGAEEVLAETVNNQPSKTNHRGPSLEQTIPKLSPPTDGQVHKRSFAPHARQAANNPKDAPFNYANEKNFEHKPDVVKSVPKYNVAPDSGSSLSGHQGRVPLIVDELMDDGRPGPDNIPASMVANDGADGVEHNQLAPGGARLISGQIGQRLKSNGNPPAELVALRPIGNSIEALVNEDNEGDNYSDDGWETMVASGNPTEARLESPRNNIKPGLWNGLGVGEAAKVALPISGAESIGSTLVNRVSDYLLVEKPKKSSGPLESHGHELWNNDDERALIIDGNQKKGANLNRELDTRTVAQHRWRRDTQPRASDQIQVRTEAPVAQVDGHLAGQMEKRQWFGLKTAVGKPSGSGNFSLARQPRLNASIEEDLATKGSIGAQPRDIATHGHDPSQGHKLPPVQQNATSTSYLRGNEKGQQERQQALECLGSGGDKSAISCKHFGSAANARSDTEPWTIDNIPAASGAKTRNLGPHFTVQTKSNGTSRYPALTGTKVERKTKLDDQNRRHQSMLSNVSIESSDNNVQVREDGGLVGKLVGGPDNMVAEADQRPSLKSIRRGLGGANVDRSMAGDGAPSSAIGVATRSRRRLVRSAIDTTVTTTSETLSTLTAPQLPNTSLLAEDDESLLWTAGQYLYLHMRAFAALSLYGVQVEVDWSNEHVNGTNIDLESGRTANSSDNRQDHGAMFEGTLESLTSIKPGSQFGDESYYKSAYNRFRDAAPFATIDLVPGQNLHLECTAQALGRLPEVKWYKRIKRVPKNLKEFAKLLTRRIGQDLYWPLTELDILDQQPENYQYPGSSRSFVCSQSVTIFDNLVNQTFTVINTLQLSQYNDFIGHSESTRDVETNLAQTYLPDSRANLVTEDGHYNTYACIVDADVRHNYATLGVHFRTKVSGSIIPMELKKRLHARSPASLVDRSPNNENKLDNQDLLLLNADDMDKNFGGQKFDFLRDNQLKFPMSGIWVPIKNVTYLRESNTDLASDLNSISATPTFLATIIVLVFGSLLGLVYLTLRSYQALTNFRIDDEEINMELMRQINNLEPQQSNQQLHQHSQEPIDRDLIFENSTHLDFSTLQSSHGCHCGSHIEQYHDSLISSDQQFGTICLPANESPPIASVLADNCSTNIDISNSELNFELFYTNPQLYNGLKIINESNSDSHLATGNLHGGRQNQSGLYEAHFHSDDAHYIYHSVSISPDLPSKVKTTILNHHEQRLVADCCSDPGTEFSDVLVPLDPFNHSSESTKFRVNMIENPMGTM